MCLETEAHSKRRARCRWLSSTDDDDNLPVVSMGLHLSGTGALEDRDVRCPGLTIDSIAVPYEVTVLGPFPDMATGRLRTMCIPTIALADLHPDYGLAAHFPDLVANRHFPGGPLQVNYMPTLPMLQQWCRTFRESPEELRDALAPVYDAMSGFTETLAARIAQLETLRATLRANAGLEKIARAMLRHAFEWAMYARRWRGPGAPYPVLKAGKVGSPGHAVSSTLAGRRVSTLPNGSMHLTASGAADEPVAADEVQDGALLNMADANWVSCLRLARANPQLSKQLVACVQARAVDGSFCPGSFELAELLEGIVDDDDVYSTQMVAILRRTSIQAIHTCRMLADYVYRVEPTWMKYEGVLMPLRMAG